MKVKGFTLIEQVLVIAIIVLLVTITLVSFSLFRQERQLEGTTAELVSTLEQARAQTLAFTGQSVYGVHVDTNQFVLFQGGSYDAAAATNKVFLLSQDVEASAWVLQGGGNDIIFDRLTGKTSQSGAITLRIKQHTSRTKTITVLTTGVVSSN